MRFKSTEGWCKPVKTTRKKIIAFFLAIGLLPLSSIVGQATPIQAQVNVFEIHGSEPLSRLADPRYRIDLLVKDHGPAYEKTIEQFKRLAPKHPELLFVIRDSFDGKPKVTVLTSATGNGRSLVAIHGWPERSDVDADAYFSEHEKFAKKEEVIKLRIADLRAKISAALAPRAQEIGRLTASIDSINERFAAEKNNLWPQAKYQRLEQLRTNSIQQTPGAYEEYAELQDELTVLQNALSMLQNSFTEPLEEKIEIIRQRSAGALIRLEKEEEEKLEGIVSQDRHSADKMQQ